MALSTLSDPVTLVAVVYRLPHKAPASLSRPQIPDRQWFYSRVYYSAVIVLRSDLTRPYLSGVLRILVSFYGQFSFDAQWPFEKVTPPAPSLRGEKCRVRKQTTYDAFLCFHPGIHDSGSITQQR